MVIKKVFQKLIQHPNKGSLTPNQLEGLPCGGSNVPLAADCGHETFWYTGKKNSTKYATAANVNMAYQTCFAIDHHVVVAI